MIIIARVIISLLLVAIFSTGCSKEPATISVYSAYGLNAPLDTIVENFEKDHPNVKVEVTYGGSVTFKNEIVQGARPDIFISADSKQITELNQFNLLSEDILSNFLHNHLVIITPINSNIDSLFELANSNIKSICVGDPNVISLGMYSEQLIQYYNLENILSSKIEYEASQEEIVRKISDNECSAGIVFMTTVIGNENVRIIKSANNSSIADVGYSAAVLADSENMELSKEFLKYLVAEESGQLFKGNGFTLTYY